MSLSQETVETKAGPTISASSIAESEHTPANTPSSFKALKKPELLAAREAFAINVDKDANNQELLAAITESGVTWAMYAKQFRIPGWEELQEQEEELFLPEPVDDWEEKEEDPMSNVVTAEERPKLDEREKYLVKFIGKNPYFEHKRFKFTQDRPYAIMSAEQADEVLESEPTKFRQAFPKELKEFYS